MRNQKYTLAGFACFFVTVATNIVMGIFIYQMTEGDSIHIRIIYLLLLIIFSSLLCTIIDYIRRRIMIDRPLKEILDATKMISRGNFNIRLVPFHSTGNFTEYDYIKEELNKMAEVLSKNEILKSDFIANVSHEIKTPLSVIQSYANALSVSTLDEETKNKYIRNLKDSCKKLNILITNILSLNKLENQRYILNLERFNLSQSLIEQVLLYEELIEKKELNLECDIDEDLFITSEKSLLEIIWNNLISNAIKFTEKNGTIKVSLKKYLDKYIIRIQDTGCGMNKETGSRIFEKFYQGDTSHSSEGNGLGLALVKKVIDILGGIIEVESELNKGTTFKVSISEGKNE